MIPVRNLWEVKNDIIQQLEAEFTDIQVGDNMLKREYNNTSGYKLCRVSIAWIPDKQRLSMKGTLNITLYYDGANNIEIDMGRISDYLQYGDIEDKDITEIRETYRETDHWKYKVTEAKYRNLISEENEGILPNQFTVIVFPKR